MAKMPHLRLFTILQSERVAVEFPATSTPFAEQGDTMEIGSFQYVPIAQIADFYPSYGPVFGGTTIMVRGMHFVQFNDTSDLLRCRFGLQLIRGVPDLHQKKI